MSKPMNKQAKLMTQEEALKKLMKTYPGEHVTARRDCISTPNLGGWCASHYLINDSGIIAHSLVCFNGCFSRLEETNK